MNKLLSIALLTLVVAGCQQTQKQEEADVPQVDPNAITCDGIGPVKLSYSYAALDSAVGANNLENGTATVDGQTIHTTKVFPNEAEEITVYWAENKEPYTTATKISIANNFGPYQTAEGLRVGSTLNEVKEYNNFMPITMSNFYNNIDGFARIRSFNGGDIETNYPCLTGKLDIIKQRAVDVRTLDEIKPQAELKSSHKLFNALDVEVVELSISAE
ncbi:lipoprotein [Parapedobacter sp. 10938]|uniref:lipoprotein n=1 Tax=Parapedobacter flavus TaxID=3110225 RepID=UPI002DC04480|nr:hypothetical protein [Parapedobacter sp. 10938]MEC3879870.1 hypothetical protein [Parapedobacter sp. 10938]